MSAHAYSSGSRRHARHYVRDTATEQQKIVTRKSADVLVLVPKQQKLGQLTETKSVNRAGLFLTLLLVAAAHLAIAWQVNNQPEPVITKAEVPPMTVEFYRPPVETPPPPQEQPKEPPKPEPVVQKPKPVDKPKPKPVEQKPEPVPQQIVQPEPQPAPPPPPAEPVLTKASADAGYLRNPAPRYPDFAQQQGWEGTVILNVHVLENGKPKAVEIKQSSGRKILDESAIQAVKRWSFVPAKLGDTPTESWVEVPIDFRLTQ